MLVEKNFLIANSNSTTVLLCVNAATTTTTSPTPTPFHDFGPGGLRACVLACAMRSLAIVIAIVQASFFLFSLFFLSPSFAFDPLRGISRVWELVSPNILA